MQKLIKLSLLPVERGQGAGERKGGTQSYNCNLNCSHDTKSKVKESSSMSEVAAVGVGVLGNLCTRRMPSGVQARPGSCSGSYYAIKAQKEEAGRGGRLGRRE